MWEGAPRFLDTLTAVYIPGWFGLWLLSLVVRDYRLATFGRPTLTKEQRDAIDSKLLEFGRISAIKLYLEALPSASLAEAKAYIDQLESEWRQRDPQTHAAVEGKSREVNWRLMAICASVEAAALIFLWLAVPTVRLMGIGFAEGFAQGLFLMAVPRLMLASSWQRSLAIFLVMMLMVLLLFGVLEYYSGTSPKGSQGTYFLGMLFGAALLISGFAPRRHGKRQLV